MCERLKFCFSFALNFNILKRKAQERLRMNALMTTEDSNGFNCFYYTDIYEFRNYAILNFPRK